MRHSLTPDHREFFSKNQFIELEEILTVEQAEALAKLSDEIVTTRLKKHVAPHYDLWREDDKIKRMTQKLQIAEVAADLFKIRPLRMGFDLYLPIEHKMTSPYPASTSLENICSFKPLAGAMLLMLSPPIIEKNSHLPLPKSVGSALFFSPQFPVPWHELFSLAGAKFFLVVFATDRTIYHAETRDQHTHLPKRLGYVFGDMLKDSIHPLLLR